MKNEKLVKAFALILLVGVLSSFFVISSSADSYQSIAPITFSNFEGVYSAVAFPGAASLPLASNGTVYRTYLNYSDYSEHSARILYDTYYDTLKVPYIQISLSCNYSSVYLGSILYSGSHSASTITDTFSGLTTFECYSAEHSYTPNVTYFYTWNIILGNFLNYDDVYIHKIFPGNGIMYLKAMVINNSIIYANIIYNNFIGSISDYATNATNAEKVNISTISSSSLFPLVFTDLTISGNKCLYNDSVNSLHYNPNSNTLTSPTVSATNLKTTSIGNTTSGNSITFNDVVSLKDYSYVKGVFNCKGSDHENSGISISGGSTTTPPSVTIRAKDSSTTNGIVLTGRNGNTAAKIVVYSGTGGTCTITGGSTSISSDERLKDFTNDIDIDFDKLKQIPKKYFTWKHDDEKVLNIGTSAQVVENVYPEIVDENFNEDDGIFYKSVDYSKLSIIALAAIDKLNDRIVELEKKIKELEQA